MTKHYSTTAFFRQTPNALLARYFHSRGLFEDFNFAGMKETKIEPLFEAWLAIPDKQRAPLEADFKDIHEMSNEAGWLALLQEADWQFKNQGKPPEALAELRDKLAALSNHAERAMVVFLDHQECWRGALLFHHADRLAYWRTRNNLPRKPAAVDDASIKQLETLISEHFRKTEGRGKNCKVEPFRRGDRDYFFAYPEDHSKHGVEWVDSALNPRPHNPAFEIVFDYSEAAGALDINFRGERKVSKALQELFVRAILKVDVLPPEEKNARVYDLNPLAKKDFEFKYPPASGIQKVAIRKLRLSSRTRSGDRITLEADSNDDPRAIYALYESISTAAPLHQYNVTHVELAVSVQTDAQKPAKTLTFRISHPNSCSLKREGIDATLRDMLKLSRIELKTEPADSAVPAPAAA